jgi:hypothetical protein
LTAVSSTREDSLWDARESLLDVRQEDKSLRIRLRVGSQLGVEVVDIHSIGSFINLHMLIVMVFVSHVIGMPPPPSVTSVTVGSVSGSSGRRRIRDGRIQTPLAIFSLT